MQKYEKFPEIFSMQNKIKRDKANLRQIKKERKEYKWLLGKKKHDFPSIKSELKLLYNKHLLEIESEFENNIAKARFQNTDVNELYEKFNIDKKNMQRDFSFKIKNRQNKARDEINSIASALKLRIEKIKEINVNIKRNKTNLKIKWKELKFKRIANEVIYQETYDGTKKEASELIKRYTSEYKDECKRLREEFVAKNPDIKHLDKMLRRFRVHRLKPFKTEQEKLVYELSIEMNFLETQLKSKIDFQTNKVANAKLEIRYNRGKADPLPLNFYLERFARGVNLASDWKFIAALRNGFFALMPLIIVGAVFVIFNNTFISPEYGGFLNLFSFSLDTLKVLENIRGIGQSIYNAGFAFYAFLLAGAIAYNLAPHYKASRWSMMILAMGCYIIVNPSFATNIEVMGITGLFIAVIVSIFSSVIYGNISKNERLKIQIDKTNVPEGVIKSFNVMIPFAITLIVFSIVEFIISYVGYAIGDIVINGTVTTINSLNQVLVIVLQYPLTEAVSSIFGMVVIIFFWQLLWFIGVNPQGIILPIIEPLQLSGLLQNQASAAAGAAPHYIFTNSFMYSFIQIGGSGGTLGFVLALLIFTKRAEWRAVTKLALIPMLFSINEPILFGIPIILNPILFIPFIFGPICVGIFSYLATQYGFVEYTTVFVPQNIMPVFGGFASTRDVMGIALSVINIGILTTIYAPFVVFANKLKKKEQVRKFKTNDLPNIIILKGLEIRRRREKEQQESIKVPQE